MNQGDIETDVLKELAVERAICLSPPDGIAFAQAICEPPPPNDALQRAFSRRAALLSPTAE